MKALLQAAAGGLPPLLGVLLGIRAFTGGSIWIAVIFASLMLACVVLAAGRDVMHRLPNLARWLIEFWVVAAVAVLALATAAGLWIGLEPLPPIFGIPVGDDATKAVTGAFAGAITTYVALVWTKDLMESKGVFSPGAQFKEAMAGAYKNLRVKPAVPSKTSEAMFEDVVRGHSNLGWDFDGRAVRAKILADHIRQSRSQHSATTAPAGSAAEPEPEVHPEPPRRQTDQKPAQKSAQKLAKKLAQKPAKKKTKR